ncbi:MAG TPA: segregation/condensation protein A [Ktedonobacteraceae bacterium]|nr:segregation/condensation protein A [Ktedonobacteraceae bacterium]
MNITPEKTEIGNEQALYIVRLPTFVGPLDLLLYLIERRQMEITTISLVAVTDQYLAYLHSHDKSGSHTPTRGRDKSGPYGQDPAAGASPLANMAAFISIAARLLFIKSQSLLPTTSKEEPGSEGENAIVMADELRRHLLEYKAAKEIAHLLRQREEAGLQTYERSGLLASIEAQLAWTPPALIGVEPQGLAQAFLHLLRRSAKEELNGTPLLPLARVSVHDRIAEIIASLNKQPRISLAELTVNEPSRLVIIVTFLAILDMWKQERISVRQDTPFGLIYLERGTHWAETESSKLDNH